MKQIRNWFRLRNLEQDFARELQYHLDSRVSDLILSGLSEAEARKQATLELGGITQIQEEVRDVWLTRWLRDLTYDLRFSARSFRRNPSFTATAVLSLALGIGATTAIYSLVDQILLHTLPVRSPERLVLIDWKGDQVGNAFGSYNLMSYPICRDLQQQERFFEGVLCRAAITVNLSTSGENKPTAAEIVSGTYFPVLGVRPALGRVLTVTDDQAPGASPVVVLSYDYWTTQLAGDPDAVGKKVMVNQHPMTIVGVATPGFHGIDVGEVPALWIPAAMSEQMLPSFHDLLDRRTSWMQVLGRLKPDMTLPQARAGLQPWFQAMLNDDLHRAGFPSITAERRQRFLGSTLALTPAPQGHSSLRRRLSQPLWVLLAATIVLLGLACLNVAGLFLARGSVRHREIHTRLALGASRGRIGRQLLADSLLLALAGGLLGVLLAPLAVRTLIAFLPRDIAANSLQAVIDTRLLLFAFAISVTTGFLAGFAPALQAGRSSLISSLRERVGTVSGGIRLRRILVTAQIAFTLILVIGAALFVRTLTGLMAKGPGFDTSSLISFGIDPLRNGYTPAEANRLMRRIQDELRTSRNVQTSAIARFQLLSGGSWNNPMTIQTNQRMITDREVHLNAISPGFFATLGTRLVAGRDFEERDSLPVNAGGRRTAIVNEAFVKRYFDGRSPLGAHICQGAGPDTKPDLEIIGVVANISYRGLREEREQAYFPIISGEGFAGNFYVRVQGSTETALQSIRTILRDADPALPLTYFRTLNEQVNRSLNTERMLATLSGSFGMLALLLSLVGLYGVMSFVVTQRTREIGIRLALGATRLTAVWLVLRDALLMIFAGIAIALPCVWALGRLIESQLYDVQPTDPVAIAGAIVVLCATAMCAAFIPAHRAAAVNPTDALRFE
ncbi:ABC transporter permease [Bryobacter aggregatus]|uniref:ABC transporter permease n=1 Tax=Bryobacter aggregatus TaxID=360054 RepID=UPI0004E1E7D2|nr:ABC transporter permease [Bryobacter aggregatus]